MAGLNVSMPLIDGIVVLDLEGRRVAVKYYNDEKWPSLQSETAFEQMLFSKTQRTNPRGEPEIMLLESHMVVYKFVADLQFYVVGKIGENELLLNYILAAFYEGISLLLRNNVEKAVVLENMDLVLLTIDEIVDGGVVLETDPGLVANRVSMRGADADMPLSEQTLGQAFANAKEQLARSLR